MSEQRDILLHHAARYPAMRPCDAVKLLYQSACGGGHLIADPLQALRRLRQEMAPLSPDDGPLAEEIGGGFGRLHLRAAKREGLSPETVGALFVRSAREARGGVLRLTELEALTRAGEMPFGSAELEEYLAEYRAAGCPMVSHSEAYRAAYRPAYRVIETRYIPLLPLLAAVDRQLEAQSAVSLALDGRCAAGKTTLAARLAEIYPFARVVHMDDFFLPPALRTPQRLKQPGGNVHFERFLAEAGEGVRTGAGFSHRVFNCAKGDFDGERRFEKSRLTLVEGSYCMRPDLEPLYTLSAFLDVDPDEQMRRIAARNGPEGLRVFAQRGIPLEERYFDEMDVRGRCRFVL